MSSRRADALWLIAAFAVVALLTLARPQRNEAISTYSSYDTGPNGYRAVYEVMRREGVRTRRLAGLELPHSFQGTFVVAPSSETIGIADARRLARIVRAGARLVVLGDVLPRGGALPVPATTAIPEATVASGVASVTASFSRAFVTNGKKPTRTLLAVRGRSVAAVWPLGRGRVVAIAAPGVFSNAGLAKRQNALFAYDVLAPQQPLLFGEPLGGASSGTSMWGVLPAPVHDAVWIALGILVLAVFGALFRSAPPAVLEPPRLRDSSAYVASMAALLQRAQARSAGIERFSQDAQRIARMRPGAASTGAIAAQCARLAEIRAIARPGDAALLEAARLYAHLRKELA